MLNQEESSQDDRLLEDGNALRTNARGLAAGKKLLKRGQSVLRILALAPETPQPIGGGGSRAYHLLKALASHADLHLVVLLEEGRFGIPEDLHAAASSIIQLESGFRQSWSNAKEHQSALKRGLSRVLAPWRHSGLLVLEAAENICCSRSEHPEPSLGALHRLYRSILQSEVSLGTEYFGLRPARTMERYREFTALWPRIRKLLLQCKPDVIWVEHTYLLPYLRDLRNLCPTARIACDAHNIEHLLHSRMQTLARSCSAKEWYRVQARACQQMEKRGLQGCDLAFCCSEADRSLALELAPKLRVEVSPNGVDTRYFQQGQAMTPTPRLLFTGTFAYPPNRDAVRFFISEILPVIRQSVPECRLCLAGLGADDFSTLAQSDPLIEIDSDVPDIRPCFDKSVVVVVPLRSGSGTRIKILEAMSMGRPVISTKVGAEGIEAVPEKHLCIADTPRAFAAKTVDLLKNPDQRRLMGIEARRHVRERYDWADIAERALAQLEQTVNTPKAAGMAVLRD